MTFVELAPVVHDIEPLRACLLVEASSGALGDAFVRGAARLVMEPDALARAVAGLARAQTDLVTGSEPARACTLEWPEATVVVRAVGVDTLLVLYFAPDVALGLLRMHVGEVVSRVEAGLADGPGPQGDPASEPPAVSELSARSRGRELLAYLDEHAPDTHAALLRVSLQTGLPLSVLETPERLSDDEFAQVAASVRRILGVEHLPF